MKNMLFGLTAVFSLLLNPGSPEGALVPKRSVLENGLVLLTSEQKALPMVSIELLIDAGSRYDPPLREGLANLAATLLTYGTRSRTALQINDTLDYLGAYLSTECSQDLASISITILKKDLATGLDLLADILVNSTFPEKEIDGQKQSIIASIRAREESPGDIARKRFAETLYPQSPYGRPVEGTEDSVKTISQPNLREFYRDHYSPNRAILAVVGDISHQEIAVAIDQAFRSWNKGRPWDKVKPPTTIGAAETIRVHKDLTQANIILGHQGVGRENADFYALQVMNYILGGGGFSSRAMDAIRNERGLAYSVYSYFNAERGHGTFEFVMQTQNETAREAIRLARDEIRRMREELVSEEELNDAKDFLTGSFPLRFDTSRRVASFIAYVEFFQLGADYPERYPEAIRKVTREEVMRVAKQYLHPDRIISVIVGNQKKVGDS